MAGPDTTAFIAAGGRDPVQGLRFRPGAATAAARRPRATELPQHRGSICVNCAASTGWPTRNSWP